MTPLSSAAASLFTFSVSSSTTGSPTATASPSPFSQRPTVASTTDSPKLGTRISVATLHLSRRGLGCRDRIETEGRLHQAGLRLGVPFVRSLGGAGPPRPSDIDQ